MAERPEIVVYVSAEMLRCGICHEVLRCPKSLPCLHTFCKDCIDNAYKHRTYTTNEARCPTCRQKYVLNFGGANKLPDNFHFNTMISAYREKEKSQETLEGEPKCGHCSRQAAGTHCLHCNKLFCRKCLSNHDSFSGHADHKICELSTMTDKDRQNIIRFVDQVSECNLHNLRPNRFCNTCSRSVCPDCFVQEHQSHDTERVQSASPTTRDFMENAQRNAKRLEIEMRANLNKTEESLKNLQSDKAKLTDDVKKCFMKFREMVDKEEDRLISHIQSDYGSEEKNINTNKAEIMASVSSAEDLLSQIDSVTKVGPDICLLAERNQIQSWITQLETDLQSVILEPIRNSRIFVKGTLFNQSIENEVGFVETKTDFNTDESSNVYEHVYDRTRQEGGEDRFSAYQNEPNQARPRPNIDSSQYGYGHQGTSRESLVTLPSEEMERYSNLLRRRVYSTSDIGIHQGVKPSAVSFTREKQIIHTSGIAGIAVTKEGNVVAVCNKENCCLIFDRKGNQTGEVKRKLTDPWDVDFIYSEKGRRSIVYISDGVSGNSVGSIKYFSLRRGKPDPCKTFVSGGIQPAGVATTSNKILVCDKLDSTVKIYSIDGKMMKKIGSGVDQGVFSYPIYISPTCENAFIVSDQEKNALICIDENGRIKEQHQVEISCPAQTSTDANGCVFMGSFDCNEIYAFLDDDFGHAARLLGPYGSISRPVAFAVDDHNRIWVGHDNGMDLLHTQHIYRFTE